MQIQIGWLLQKPTDLDLYSLQRQDISGFSMTRVPPWQILTNPKGCITATFKALITIAADNILKYFFYYFQENKSLQLTLKAPITTAADDILIFFLFFRENKSWLFMWIVCWQTIHMKSQDLFSLKKKRKLELVFVKHYAPNCLTLTLLDSNIACPWR